MKKDQSGRPPKLRQDDLMPYSPVLRGSPDIGHSRLKLAKGTNWSSLEDPSQSPTLSDLRVVLCLHIPIPSAQEMCTCCSFSGRLESPSALSRCLINPFLPFRSQLHSLLLREDLSDLFNSAVWPSLMLPGQHQTLTLVVSVHAYLLADNYLSILNILKGFHTCCLTDHGSSFSSAQQQTEIPFISGAEPQDVELAALERAVISSVGSTWLDCLWNA